MKIEAGPSSDSTFIVPADRDAAVLIEGLGPDETRACLVFGERQRPWATPRRIQVCLVDEKRTASSSKSGTHSSSDTHAPSGYQRNFEDGRVSLLAGGAAHVEVDTSHREPEFPMPRSLMLAIAHQWSRISRMSLHAASIEIGGFTFLVLGDSCAGKSTLALSALTQGGRITSDDWVLLHHQADILTSYPLRNRMLIRPGPVTDQLLQQISSVSGSRKAHDSKAWLDIEPQKPDSTVLVCNAVLYLESNTPRPSRTRLETITQAQRYAAVLDSTSAALYSPALPHESAGQRTITERIIRMPGFRAVGGTDLVTEPARAWERINSHIRESS